MCITDYLTYSDVADIALAVVRAREFLDRWTKRVEGWQAHYMDGGLHGLRMELYGLRQTLARATALLEGAKAQQDAVTAAARKADSEPELWPDPDLTGG